MKRFLLLLVALTVLMPGPVAAQGEFDPFAGFEEMAITDAPAEVLAQLAPGGRYLRAPDGFGFTLDECQSRFERCETMTLVRAREVTLTDADGNKMLLGLGPGIYAVGSSTAYKWTWADNMEYFALVGGNVVFVGAIYATYKVTLSGRQSTWVQTSDVWQGPAVRTTHQWNCIDDNGLLPNTSCTGGWQSHQNSSYTVNQFTSQDQVYHYDNETYWWDFKVSWRASGWSGWVWGLGPWSTHHFNCSGSSCQF